MPSQTLAAALVDADGRPVDVTRVETEILESGDCRWILWSGERRIYSCIVPPRDIAPMLEATRLVLESNSHSLRRQRARRN